MSDHFDASDPRTDICDLTADLIVALLTRGRITSDGVGPHMDLLDEFPYLGAPH